MTRNLIKKILLAGIRLYQRHFNLTNPLMRIFFGTATACRFAPTCSMYMYEAVEKHGILAGLSLGFKRILRCHPWNRGGIDPVPGKL